MVMVTEVMRRWRVQRGARCVAVRTRTALPSRRCTAALIAPALGAPEVRGLGGDELRVRAYLLALRGEL